MVHIKHHHELLREHVNQHGQQVLNRHVTDKLNDSIKGSCEGPTCRTEKEVKQKIEITAKKYQEQAG